MFDKAFSRTRQRIEWFLFRPVRTLPFTVFRTGIALSLLFEAFSVGPAFFALVGSDALIHPSVALDFQNPFYPSFYEALGFLERFLGLGERAALWTLIGFYLTTVATLLSGWKARSAAAAAWIFHMLFVNGTAHTTYGVDRFHHIALFYLMIFPGSPSLLGFLRDRTAAFDQDDSPWARLVLRTLQAHLCVVYFVSGYEKLVSPQWHNGEVIWRAMMLPIYQQFDFSWLAGAGPLVVGVAWGTIALELGYGVFIWPKKTRLITGCLVLSLHLGIGLFLGLWVFAFAMSVFTLAAFVVASEPADSKAVFGAK